jgi:hypothetical protein
MLLHGLYDFLTYAYEATLLTAGVALMLWSYVVWRTGLWRKEALARQVANGEK